MGYQETSSHGWLQIVAPETPFDIVLPTNPWKQVLCGAKCTYHIQSGHDSPGMLNGAPEHHTGTVSVDREYHES